MTLKLKGILKYLGHSNANIDFFEWKRGKTTQKAAVVLGENLDVGLGGVNVGLRELSFELVKNSKTRMDAALSNWRKHAIRNSLIV